MKKYFPLILLIF